MSDEVQRRAQIMRLEFVYDFDSTLRTDDHAGLMQPNHILQVCKKQKKRSWVAGQEHAWLGQARIVVIFITQMVWESGKRSAESCIRGWRCLACGQGISGRQTKFLVSTTGLDQTDW